MVPSPRIGRYDKEHTHFVRKDISQPHRERVQAMNRMIADHVPGVEYRGKSTMSVAAGRHSVRLLIHSILRGHLLVMGFSMREQWVIKR